MSLAVETYDGSIESVPFERKIALLKDTETLCFAYDPVISKVDGVYYRDSEDHTVIANTRGLFQSGRSTSYRLSADVLAERDGEVESGGETSQSRFFDDLDPPSAVASRACWKAKVLLGGRTVPTQSVPVVFDRDTGYALLNHLFGMVNGGNIADGLSMLDGRLGDRIGSKMVTIVDDPTIERGMGSRAFDAEGVPGGRTVILNRGVLESFLFDTRSGRKAGFASTGNAGRGGFRQLPDVAQSNLFMEKGDSEQEEVIRNTDRGLWVMGLAGWWTNRNPTTGVFSSGAKGLWIEGGEVAYPVKNVTIASTVPDMLGGIDMIASDLLFRFSTVAPTFRVRDMRLGGL
jgi:PmbA protein